MAVSPDSWLQEGIAAARAGQTEQARALLVRVIQADERNVQAWYWLSRVVREPREREICLKNVLALDPGHTAVQAELAELRRQMAAAEKASLLSRESIAAAVPRTVAEQLAAEAAVEQLPCPYCGAPTGADDRDCPVCGGELYVRRPKSKGHSVYSLGLVVVWLGIANCVWLGAILYYFLSGLFSAAEASPGVGPTFETLGELLGLEGLSSSVPELPLAPLLLAGGIFLLSLLVAWGLYRRLRLFYWLTVGLVLFSPLLTIFQVAAAETVSLWPLALEGVLFLLAISFAFMAYDEFAWVEVRLDAAVDKDVDSPSALYARGRENAGRGMWAKAAAHWSKAVALSPGHADYRVALASAYINLDRPEQALEHLQAARRIEPNHPQLAQWLSRVGEPDRNTSSSPDKSEQSKPPGS